MLLKVSLLVCFASIGVYYFKFYQLGTSEGKLNEGGKHVQYADIDEEIPTLFTKEEVANYVTEDKLYLVILGHVFDVTKGKGYYKAGETYHCFVGRDGSRAFVSGNFTDAGLTEDIDDITGTEAIELNNWLDFYRENYVFKGQLIGRFFNSQGSHTKNWHQFQVKLKEAQEDSEEVVAEKLKYPPCNIAWSQDEGTRVWCSTKSGGIERDWSGVPRKLYTPGADSYRCACVQLETDSDSGIVGGRQGNIETYEDCDVRATSCYVQNAEED